MSNLNARLNWTDATSLAKRVLRRAHAYCSVETRGASRSIFRKQNFFEDVRYVANEFENLRIRTYIRINASFQNASTKFGITRKFCEFVRS